MDYIRIEADGQLAFSQSTEYLFLPSCLYGFHNTETTVENAKSKRIIYCHRGFLDLPEEERVCTCGQRMHINSHPDIYIRHLSIGGNLSGLLFPHNQLRCPKCGATKSQFISFKAEGHLITDALHQYTCDLLARGTYTNKQVAEITGLGENTVKEIDKKRLRSIYTTDDGKKLIKPEKQAKYLGIDEFKLHNGRRYATHIIDLESGHVLWIQNGKSKQVVYDFIDHVGMEWMSGVEAVACDMNSDFQEAFEEKCYWIQPVFDYFHIVKNFNDKVVSEVRKDEQRRLYEEGNIEAAKALKKTRYILMSNRSTLQKKDEDAASERVIHKGSPLFKTEDIKRKSGYQAKYDALLQENKLLFTLDLIKEKLSAAYAMTDESKMADAVIDIIDICKATNNKHLLWFAKLLDTHFEGMYRNNTHSVKDRIVSISQPYIRPIVRGKAKAPTEFGAKLDMSIDEKGIARLERLSFDAYNECGVLIGAIENYHERTGHYPERVLVDQIYRNRNNRDYCKKHDIRISGPALGRPKNFPKKKNCRNTMITQIESKWKEDSVLQSAAMEWD